MSHPSTTLDATTLEYGHVSTVMRRWVVAVAGLLLMAGIVILVQHVAVRPHQYFKQTVVPFLLFTLSTIQTVSTRLILLWTKEAFIQVQHVFCVKAIGMCFLASVEWEWGVQLALSGIVGVLACRFSMTGFNYLHLVRSSHTNLQIQLSNCWCEFMYWDDNNAPIQYALISVFNVLGELGRGTAFGITHSMYSTTDLSPSHDKWPGDPSTCAEYSNCLIWQTHFYLPMVGCFLSHTGILLLRVDIGYALTLLLLYGAWPTPLFISMYYP